MHDMKTKAREMMEKTILPFWLSMKDDEKGGWYGYKGFDLVLDKKADKGGILHSRILWFFSEAALWYRGKDEALSRTLGDAAHHAYLFLRDHMVDREKGGMYWSVTYDGAPADTTKHTYAQAFLIYGLSSYYLLTRDREALDLAYWIFRLMEEHCRDEVGYLEAFTREWGTESNEKLSENGVMAQKTMNTLLHVFEGYSNLYRADGGKDVEAALRWILSIYSGHIYDKEGKKLFVFFDENYSSIIDLWSYGHDIESSWLVDWGTDLLGDDALSSSLHALDTTLAESVYATAYRNHALLNECERGMDDPTRHWWVQAEAVLGFLNEYRKSGDRKYLEAAEDIYAFIEGHFIDPREGSEWYSAVDGEGKPIGKPILESWKCPYHNGRMCLRILEDGI